MNKIISHALRINDDFFETLDKMIFFLQYADKIKILRQKEAK